MAGALLTLSAIDWGLVGAADFDPVQATLGRSRATRAARVVMGGSAVYALARGSRLLRG